MVHPRDRLSRSVVAVVVVSAALAHVSNATAQTDSTAPVASIRPNAGITAPQTISFNEAVKGVTGDNVALFVTYPRSKVPATPTCRDASGTTVPCAGGGIRSVLLRSNAPLVAGEGYTITVNPSGVTPVTDTAGNPAAITTQLFRAAIWHQETSVASPQWWTYVRSSSAYDGDFRSERVRGAVARFDFTGPSVTWWTRTGPNQGKAAVYIDGDVIGVTNNYEPTERWRVARTYRYLGTGSHRIEVVVLGERGSSSATNRWVTVDGFGVGALAPSGDQVRYRWDDVAAANASSGHYVQTSTRGAQARFTFRGRGVDWYTVTGPDMGIAAVYIDGVLKRYVDNYSASRRYGVRRTFAGLSDGRHVITVYTLGKKRAASRGSYVAVDLWRVRFPDITSFAKLGAWIDRWDYAHDPYATISFMRSKGVKTLYLETATFSSSSAFLYPGKVDQWIEAAHNAGIRVIGWYLAGYGEHLDKDVYRTVAIARYRTPRGHAFDGLAIDIEWRRAVEDGYEWARHIENHLYRVRKHVGETYPVGAITFDPGTMDIYPKSTFWTQFPWKAINRYADVEMPMGYWSARDGCPEIRKHCAYEYSKYNIEKSRQLSGLPVHLIGGCCARTTTAEVADFVRASKDARAYGGSYYDYGTTASAYWAELTKLNAL